MNRNRTVAGLDVHKDSIYLCIMGHDEVIIFEKKYGVLTPAGSTGKCKISYLSMQKWLIY